MSAIQSLLRVMTLRDAEAMVLEAGKAPSLRRRGQVEALAMPAIEGKMIEDFTAPLLGDKPAGEWPTSVPFKDSDGTTYNLTIERTSSGNLRVVVRKGTPAPKAAPPPPAPAATESKAWWAKKGEAKKPEHRPEPEPELDDGVVEEAASADDSAARELAHRGATAARRSRGSHASALARLGRLLAPLVTAARDHDLRLTCVGHNAP